MLTYVTKSITPEITVFNEYVKQIFVSGTYTNNGQLCNELIKRISLYLDVHYLTTCANGTLGLELALQAAMLSDKKVITTPFSYVATVSSLLWRRCEVIFADIDEETLAIDPSEIEKKLTDDIAGILPVFIYGHPCNTYKIEEIAKKAGDIPVIYDAAQAFGAKYLGRSLLDYGDYSVCSFHATKVFHTAEGGCVVTHSREKLDELNLLKAFGHSGDNHKCLGVNAKMSEMNAAIGLTLLDQFEEWRDKRRKVCSIYDAILDWKYMRRPTTYENFESNYGYYPVIFNSEKTVLEIIARLEHERIQPRRYFYPSLNTLPYVNYTPCPISENISRRILCLPLHGELEEWIIHKTAEIVNNIVKSPRS